MVRNVAPLPTATRRQHTEVATYIAPLATSGAHVGNRDLSGAMKSEVSVSELISREREYDEKGHLVDEEGKPKKIPVLRDGKWVLEVAGTSAVRRHASPGAGGARLVMASDPFDLTFQGSANIGINIKELGDEEASRSTTLPAGHRVVVASVQPGSAAAQQKVKAGFAVLSINGTSTKGLARKETQRLLAAAGSGRRVITFVNPDAVPSLTTKLAPTGPPPNRRPDAACVGNIIDARAADPPAQFSTERPRMKNVEAPVLSDVRATRAKLEGLFGTHAAKQQVRIKTPVTLSTCIPLTLARLSAGTLWQRAKGSVSQRITGSAVAKSRYG